jgi:hypothetical protein
MLFDFLVFGEQPAPTIRHRLAGTVTVDGQPAARLVCVFDRLTMVLLAAKWSDPATGAWEIAGLSEYPEGGIFVIASGHPATENAAVFDSVSQVAS